MTANEKAAIETAYDFFKNPGNYPLVNNPNSPERNKVIFETIYSLFDINDDGELTGFNKETIDKFSRIKALKGIQ